MASSRNYRPRPIDVRKPMPLLREVQTTHRQDQLPGEVTIQGEDGLMEEGVQKNTGMSAEDAEEKNFVAAFQASVEKLLGNKSSGTDIPIPGVKNDLAQYKATFKKLKPFELSSSYIRNFGSQTTERGHDKAFDELVQIEMDLDDEKWLAKFNAGKKTKITEEQLEYCLDRFEKEVASYDKLPLHRAERLVTAGSDLRGNLIKEVYTYWEQKRKLADKPLIACFQLPTDPNDNDPAKTFRPREKEVSIRRRLRKQQNDKDAFQQLHKIQSEFEQASQLVSLVVARENMKLDWLKARFELIQAELERNPTLYYVIHGKPYVPPKTTLVFQNKKRGLGQLGSARANAHMSPRQIYEQQQREREATQNKKRKLMRRICMPDGFKLQFKRGLELGPATTLREQLLLTTLAPTGLSNTLPNLQHRALFSRARIGRCGRLVFDRYPIGPRHPEALKLLEEEAKKVEAGPGDDVPPWHGLPYGYPLSPGHGVVFDERHPMHQMQYAQQQQQQGQGLTQGYSPRQAAQGYGAQPQQYTQAQMRQMQQQQRQRVRMTVGGNAKGAQQQSAQRQYTQAEIEVMQQKQRQQQQQMRLQQQQQQQMRLQQQQQQQLARQQQQLAMQMQAQAQAKAQSQAAQRPRTATSAAEIQAQRQQRMMKQQRQPRQ